jgi:MFS family permease
MEEIKTITFLNYSATGFRLGAFQYVFKLAVFDYLGGDAKALSIVAFFVILGRFLNIIAEVPTGAIGDHLGRKKTVVLALCLFSFSSALNTFIFFIPEKSIFVIVAGLATIIVSLATAFDSGTFYAWLVDSVRNENIPEGHGPITARANKYLVVSKLFGTVIAIFLYLNGFVYFAFAFVSVFEAMCALYCGIVMKETEGMKFYKGQLFIRKSIVRMKEIIGVGFSVCLKNPFIKYLIIVKSLSRGMIFSILFLWAIAMKASFGTEKMDFFWYLVVFASFTAAYLGSHLLERQGQRHTDVHNTRIPNLSQWKWIVLFNLGISVVITGLGMSKIFDVMNIYLFIGALFVLNFGYGYLFPSMGVLFNYYIPVEHSSERATIMSFSAMIESLVLMLLIYPASGLSGGNIVVGWMIPAVLLFIVVLIINPLMRKDQTNEKDQVTEQSLKASEVSPA